MAKSIVQSFALVRDIGYLGISTAATSATALYAAVTASGGQLGAGEAAIAIGAGALTTGASFLTNNIGSRVQEQVLENLAESDELLSNGDWLKLSGLATSELIRQFAGTQVQFESEQKLLRDLAGAVDTDWNELAETFEQHYQSLDKPTAIKWFYNSAHVDPHKRTVLDPNTWTTILTAIGKRHGCLPSTELLETLGEHLQTNYAQAVFRLLKHIGKGDRAFRGLTLTMLGEIHEATCAVIPQAMTELSDEIKHSSTETKKAIAGLGKKINVLMRKIVHGESSHSIEKGRWEKQIVEQEQQWTTVVTELDSLGIMLSEVKNNTQTIIANTSDIQPELKSLHEKVDVVLERSEKNIPIESTAAPKTRINNFAGRINLHRRYIERKKLMTALKKGLGKKRRSAITQTQAIHGLGGVGKTQLAMEYVKQHGDNYDIIWWIHAEQTQTILTDLASLGTQLELPPNQNLEQFAGSVRQHLSSINGWLLVYDNAVDSNSLSGLLPAEGTGDVLITSRSRNWTGKAETIPVDVMNKSEAERLLKDRSNDKDTPTAKEIAKRLGYLPLALEVAAAYCAASSIKLSKYLELLDSAGLTLLDAEKAADYHAIVSATWQPSFEAAVALCPAVDDIMTILAFVDADNFPVEVLEKRISDKLLCNDALKALLAFSLIRREDGLVSIHRLVQEVYREQLIQKVRCERIVECVHLMRAVIPNDHGTNLESRNWLNEFYPHAESVISFANPIVDDLLQDSGTPAPESVQSIVESLSYAIGELGALQYIFARFADAEPLMRRALEIDEASFGKEHPSVAIDLNNLAQLLQATNRLDEAEPLMRRALEIFEVSLGPDHLNTQTVANNYLNLRQQLEGDG